MVHRVFVVYLINGFPVNIRKKNNDNDVFEVPMDLLPMDLLGRLTIELDMSKVLKCWGIEP